MSEMNEKNPATLEARRGFIYEFDDGRRDETRYVLVVSAQERSMDNRISILMLGNSPLGRDVVTIKNNGLKGDSIRYVHCAMITYTNREYLVREMGRVSPEKMNKIDHVIAREFGLFPGMETERDFYKEKYDEIIKMLATNWGERNDRDLAATV